MSARTPPAIASRFQPGTSGNPSGRKKIKPDFYDDALAILSAPITIKTEDRILRLPAMKAAARQQCNRALKGDKAALRAVLELAMLSRDANAAADAELGANHAAAAAKFVRLMGWSPEREKDVITSMFREPTAAEKKINADRLKRAKAILAQRRRAALRPASSAVPNNEASAE